MSIWRLLSTAALVGALVGLGGAAAIAGQAPDEEPPDTGAPPGYGYCSASTSEEVGGVTIDQWVQESFDAADEEDNARARVAEVAGVTPEEVACDFSYSTVGSCSIDLSSDGGLPIGSEIAGWINGWYATLDDEDAVRSAIAQLAGADPSEVSCAPWDESTEPPDEEPAPAPPPEEPPTEEPPAEESPGEETPPVAAPGDPDPVEEDPGD